MENQGVLWIVAFEILLAGGLYVLLPRIARRGLLFGVYVGEEVAAGEAARRLGRIWTRTLLLLTAVALAVGILGTPLLAIVSLACLLLASFALYLWAYFAARALAPPAATPAAVAVLTEDPPAGWLPYATLAFAVATGLLGLAYAAAAYPALPQRIPIHFGISGAPDAWSTKSLGSVLLLPLMGVIQGLGLGLMCLLVAHAKRAVRLNDGGASLRAQNAFRRAMTRFLCGITILTSLLLLLVTVFSIRTGLGRSAGIPWAVLGIAGLLVLLALGGSLFLAIRYGQGGARLEGAATAPLTDGLADNRHWVLGMFYVNREDPSVLVEHRFGLGYTINLGNWKAVALLSGFLALTLGLALFAVLSVK